MKKTELKVFNAYEADKNIRYYEKFINFDYIFHYHNQPLDKDGFVHPDCTWGNLIPIKPKENDLEIKYRYKLEQEEKEKLSALDKQILETQDTIDRLKRKKEELEDEILQEVIKDFDYESIYEGDYWECHLSPVGHCIYTDDFGEPECIFCGEPEERK